MVKDKDGEIWIDPVPGANNMEPAWQTDKKINSSAMPLRDNIGSIFKTESGSYQRDIPALDLPTAIPPPALPGQSQTFYEDPVPDLDDSELPAFIMAAIDVLLKYGVLDQYGELVQSRVIALSGQLSTEQAMELNAAIDTLTTSNIGGLFQDIWRGVKKVTVAAPRGAFLSAVALNVFGMATKLKQATTTTDGANKVRNKWYSLGGDWKNLRSAIENGSGRKRIGNVIGAAPAVPAWVVTAGAIIAAMMPLVNAVLKQQKAQGMDMSQFNSEWGSGNPYSDTPTGTGIIDWIKQNPIPSALGAAAISYLLYKSFFSQKKRA